MDVRSLVSSIWHVTGKVRTALRDPLFPSETVRHNCLETLLLQRLWLPIGFGPALATEKAARDRSTEEPMMQRIICVICICWLMIPLFSQSTSDYQVGTITDVQQHKAQDGADRDATSYDVSLKVGSTMYQLLYTPPPGVSTVKYAAGRSLLVHIGMKTISYNDIVGRPSEVPIVSQRTAADIGGAK